MRCRSCKCKLHPDNYTGKCFRCKEAEAKHVRRRNAIRRDAELESERQDADFWNGITGRPRVQTRTVYVNNNSGEAFLGSAVGSAVGSLFAEVLKKDR